MSGTDPTLPGRTAVRNDAIQRLFAGVSLVAGNIYSARAWPVQPDGLPALLVYVFQEQKQLLTPGGGAPQFTVTATLAVHCIAEGQSEAAVEASLDLLTGSVEATLLLDPDWVGQFEQIGSVTTTIELKSTGDRPMGEAVLSFSLQWTENFDPELPYTLGTLSLQATAARPAGAQIGATIIVPQS